jgi:hypothetical protein
MLLCFLQRLDSLFRTLTPTANVVIEAGRKLKRGHNQERRNKVALKRRGIGLYTYEQVKNGTPFGYFAQIVVGTIVAATGALLVYHVVTVRSEEIQVYGSADPHFWGWLAGLAVILIGLFMAHAGLIYYGRRIHHKMLRPHRKPQHWNGA